jgi:hypothetical protein
MLKQKTRYYDVPRNLLNVSSTNKTDRQDIAEILLKVALITIKPTNHTQII